MTLRGLRRQADTLAAKRGHQRALTEVERQRAAKEALQREEAEREYQEVRALVVEACQELGIPTLTPELWHDWHAAAGIVDRYTESDSDEVYLAKVAEALALWNMEAVAALEGDDLGQMERLGSTVKMHRESARYYADYAGRPVKPMLTPPVLIHPCGNGDLVYEARRGAGTFLNYTCVLYPHDWALIQRLMPSAALGKRLYWGPGVLHWEKP